MPVSTSCLAIVWATIQDIRLHKISVFSPSTEVMIWFVVASGKIDELSSFLTPPFFSTKNSEKEPYSS
ncbi:MAG: hypothetical protein ACJ8CB_06405 [Ktedonobacteraceae bacterium]